MSHKEEAGMLNIQSFLPKNMVNTATWRIVERIRFCMKKAELVSHCADIFQFLHENQ